MVRSIHNTITILLSAWALAQTSRDSIHQFVQTADPIDVIDFYYETGRNVEKMYPDSALTLYRKGIELGHRIGHRKSEMDGWIELGFFYRPTDSARHYFEKSLVIADSFGYDHDQYRIRAELSLHHQTNQDYIKALEYALGSLVFTTKKRDTLNTDSLKLADTYKSLGQLNDQMGYLDKSMEYYLQALPIYIRYEDFDFANGVVANIGVIYKKNGDLDKAMEYFEQSLSHFDSTNTMNYAYATLMNIGLTLRDMDRLDEADSVIHGLLYANEPWNSDYLRAINANNLGTIKARKREFQSAKKLFHQSIHLAVKVGLSKTHIENDLALGEVHMREANYDSVTFYGQRAYRKARSMKLLDEQITALELLYQTSLVIEDFESAHDYLRATDDLEERKNRLLQESILYQLAINDQLKDREAQLAKVSYQQDLAKLEITSIQKNRLWLIIGLTVALLFLLVLAFFLRRNTLLRKELENQNQTILKQTRLLEENNELKSRFFANISHELRTPLTLIQGMLDNTLDNPEKDQSDRLKVAQRNARQLEEMISELLELSKLEVNKIEANLRPCYVRPLIDRVVSSFSSLADQNGVRYEMTLSLREDIIADLDKRKFEKVLNNLMYNAIKFTPINGLLRVKALFESEELKIRIQNEGNPIPENELDNLFDRFYQASHKSRALGSGAGLGLSIVREFTELMKGKVAVSSSQTKGTEFVLTFPARVDLLEEELEEGFETQFDLTTFGKPKILIVEDHGEMRNYLKDLLKDYFKIDLASNGEEAMNEVGSKKYDLIITDLMMPGVDGFELVDYLKSNTQHKKTPLVVLTARGSDADRLNLLGLGVDDYITKPFNAQELRIRLHNIFENLRVRLRWLESSMDLSVEEPPEEKQHALIDQLESFIKLRLNGPNLSVSELARHVAMSERQLYRKLGELTGLTPANLIKEVKLKAAMNQLQRKNYSKVEVIAKEVGFESTSYFSRQFYQRFGRKPTEFIS